MAAALFSGTWMAPRTARTLTAAALSMRSRSDWGTSIGLPVMLEPEERRAISGDVLSRMPKLFRFSGSA